MSTSTADLRRRRTTEKLARRKRTIVACQFCRLRRTRCDGIKPVCGFCQRQDAQCVWSYGVEGSEGYESTPAERAILQRLDDIKDLLETSGPPRPASNGQTLQNDSSTIDAEPTSPVTAASQSSHLPSVPLGFPSYAATRCESLLRWPVFRGFVDPSHVSLESFALEAQVGSYKAIASPCSLPNIRSGKASMTGPGIQEHLFVPLSRKFLAHVHPRNPILEASNLVRYAKRAEENGLDWDGPSCLVLVACALACYTSPWRASNLERAGAGDILNEADLAAADAYFLAARKRIGLLGCSLVDIQCLFFASVYEKYAFNPLQAWFYVQQASSRLQAHLKQHHGLEMQEAIDDSGPSENHLQQRVFWSIFKAENELLAELPFKSSGIEELTRADSMFPSPPAIPTELPARESQSPDEREGRQEERSWFFYLAEIALRRTINDTVWLLYRKGEPYWMTHINLLEQQYEESQRQISLWHAHLPDSIRFDPPQQPDNEFSFYLQGRFVEWRDYTLRPFLYFALHRPMCQAMTSRTISCAQECVSACAAAIPYLNRHHRHGGTWFVCRRTFTFALTILAVVIKGDQNIAAPPNWESLVNTAISMLCRWEDQSLDVCAMRMSLERILEAVRNR